MSSQAANQSANKPVSQHQPGHKPVQTDPAADPTAVGTMFFRGQKTPIICSHEGLAAAIKKAYGEEFIDYIQPYITQPEGFIALGFSVDYSDRHESGSMAVSLSMMNPSLRACQDHGDPITFVIGYVKQYQGKVHLSNGLGLGDLEQRCQQLSERDVNCIRAVLFSARNPPANSQSTANHTNGELPSHEQ